MELHPDFRTSVRVYDHLDPLDCSVCNRIADHEPLQTAACAEAYARWWKTHKNTYDSLDITPNVKA